MPLRKGMNLQVIGEQLKKKSQKKNPSIWKKLLVFHFNILV